MLQGLNRAIRGAQFADIVGGSHCDHFRTSRQSGIDADVGIFKYNAVLWFAADLFGGLEEYLGVGFAMADVFCADNRVKIFAQSDSVEDDLDVFAVVR